jgi:hypothetical protein
MAKKNITIDDLAVMVQKGFTGVDKRLDEMATKSEMNRRFDLVDKRFDKIENLVLASHQKRIEKLEAEVKELKELFAI